MRNRFDLSLEGQTELASRPSWERVLSSFEEWRDFEINEYYPETAYYSVEEGRTLTRDAYRKWLQKMVEEYLPNRLAKCEKFTAYLDEFRSDVGATDYGASVVEIVEGLMRAARETKDSIAGVLDACGQFGNAVLQEDTRESEEWYTLLVNREENIRRLITAISDGLNKIGDMLRS
jgi:hypothetical protein